MPTDTAPQAARLIWFGIGHRAAAKRHAAGLLLIDDDPWDPRMLLAKRADWMVDGGTWSTPGGVMDHNELEIETALRETAEETGIDYDIDDINVTKVIVQPHRSLRRLYTIVMATTDFAPDPIVDGDETTDAGWFTKEEALALNLHPDLRHIIKGL